MALKVTYSRGDERVAHIALAVPPGATARDVARSLVAGDPTRVDSAPSDPTLMVTALSTGPLSPGRTLDPDVEIAGAGIRDGDHLAVVEGASARAQAESRAVARVVRGVDKGATFPLYVGSNSVGRHPDAAVRLKDPLASPRHASLMIGEDIEVVDAGSNTGVMLGETYVTRAQVLTGDVIVIGATALTVTREVYAPPPVPTSSAVQFTRSPRVVPALPAEEVDLPAPPAKPQRRQFPRVALAAPVLMGLTMYAVTGRLFSLLFIAMSPLLMLGGYVDQRSQGKRALKAGMKEFEGALANAYVVVNELHVHEREARAARDPAVDSVVAEAVARGPMLWSRRPEHPSFLTARVGTGTVESSVRVTLAPANDSFPELWERAQAAHRELSVLEGAPVVANLRAAGGVGVAGGTGARGERDVARAIVAHLAGLHSPLELVVAGLFSGESAAQWAWLEWLPHAASPVSPLQGACLTRTRHGALAIMSGLEALIEARSGADIGALKPVPRGPLATHSAREDDGPPDLPAVLVVVEDQVPGDRRRLIRIAEKGPDVGVHVLWVARALRDIPAACRTFVEVHEQGVGAVGSVREGTRVSPTNLETLDANAATEFARRLSCVEDVGVIADDATDIPREVGYLELHGNEAADAGHYRRRWEAVVGADAIPDPGRASTLRALVGHTGHEPFYLDLRAQGPHALVGGTTGAGKSEFLQSWILSMAAGYGPDRVNFLLVDYKGGSAFAGCVELPHTVGLVTDLTPRLVDRALASLRAELRHRERLLATKGAKDLETLERRGDRDAPPSLVIVIDEFAALVNEVPAFVDGVVDIAQRGRSLGLHLILATQRPAGVIKDNLRANTNLRIALRMADAGDSTDVLGVPAAAHLDPNTPGRAIARTGPGRVAAFQAAYAGARSGATEDAVLRIGISDFAMVPGAGWNTPDDSPAKTQDIEPDVTRVVRALQEAATAAGMGQPRRPWLDELADSYDLAALGDARARGIALGLLDDPDHQDQRPFTFDPDADGNAVFYGTSGSGKTVALRTVAASASLGDAGNPVHIYGVDAAKGGLDLLAPLPNVGAIIAAEDDEGVGRLLRMLESTIDERAALFGAARAADLSEYQDVTGDTSVARILVLIDGLGALQDAYMNEPWRAHLFDSLRSIMAEGRSVGVHVIAAADRVGALHSSVQAHLSRSITLRQVDDGQYALMGLRRPPLSADSPAGRAVDLASGQEWQVAVLGGDPSVKAQAAALEELGRRLAGIVDWMAPSVPRMPAVVTPADVAGADGGPAVVGVEADSLAALPLDLGRPLLIAGQAGTGRTNALRWLCREAKRVEPASRMVLVSQRQGELAGEPWWDECATSLGSAMDLVPVLADFLTETGADAPRCVLVLEALHDVPGSELEGPLLAAVKRAKRHGHLVVGEAETSAWMNGMVASEIRSARHGIVMAPDPQDGLMLMGTQFPRLRRADLPVGRGIYVRAGKPLVVQVPHYTGELSTGLAPDQRARLAPR